MVTNVSDLLVYYNFELEAFQFKVEDFDSVFSRDKLLLITSNNFLEIAYELGSSDKVTKCSFIFDNDTKLDFEKLDMTYIQFSDLVWNKMSKDSNAIKSLEINANGAYVFKLNNNGYLETYTKQTNDFKNILNNLNKAQKYLEVNKSHHQENDIHFIKKFFNKLTKMNMTHDFAFSKSKEGKTVYFIPNYLH